MGAIKEYRGISELHVAKLTADTTAAITWAVPEELAGVAEVAKTTETSVATKYYDNKPQIVIKGTGADTVTLTVSVLELKKLALITGMFYDETLGMLVEGEGTEDYYAIQYITEKTDGTKMYVSRMKGMFTLPDESTKGKDNGTDAVGQTLVFTGVETIHKFTKTGKSGKTVVVDSSTSTAHFDTWFSAVQTPDTVVPGV